MATRSQGLDQSQLLQVFATLGVNAPDELAAILAPTGFTPPAGGPALGALAQLTPAPAGLVAAAVPQPTAVPTQAEIAQSQGALEAAQGPQFIPTAAGIQSDQGLLEQAVGETPAGPFALPQESTPDVPGGDFLKALAAIKVPETPQAPRVTNLSGNVPRLGGTIDPRQLQVLLELLSQGQSGAGQTIPALGGLIAGGR